MATDGAELAHEAGLRYATDRQPGINRRRTRTGFSYRDPAGHPIKDPAVLGRIRGLAIPPAWEDVWIAAVSNAHLQATGRDQRGRKQYRYHAKWREARDAVKFGRMPDFGRALPQIREQVEHDLRLSGLPRAKVLATVVRLLELTRMRVGNEEYARTNGSYGLTTLENSHVVIEGEAFSFSFRGKSGKQHLIDVHDRRLARVVARCQELPGHDLFEYVDEAGCLQSVWSGDVNQYLREASGSDFTAKDFRTWSGTVIAANALRSFEPPSSGTEAMSHIRDAYEAVASELGNTVAVSRKFYVHPDVIQAFRDGTFGDVELMQLEGLGADEQFVLGLLDASSESG